MISKIETVQLLSPVQFHDQYKVTENLNYSNFQQDCQIPPQYSQKLSQIETFPDYGHYNQ